MPVGSTFSREQLAFDKHHIWHPYTTLTRPIPVWPVVSAEGVRLTLDDGNQLIDGMSSWWTAIHGYNVPELNDAVERQMKKMAHVMFGGITHEPAIRLCQQLVELTPHSLNKVFLADSGSVSVEVAMKMAVQYQQAKGKPHRSQFLTVKKGYHGDTTGAMSVCDPINGMHHLFSKFLPKHYFADVLSVPYGIGCQPKDFVSLTRLFEAHAATSAAFIIEPIVQGAGGMWFYSVDYLKHLRLLCDRYEVLLIADEIATGFGRTGKLFACAHAEVVPDIMCVGKALTGGYLTLAATLCTDEVSTTICEGEAGVFMHGPTYMANPLACAVACSSLALLTISPWEQRVNAIQQQLLTELSDMKRIPVVKDVRVLGAIGVIETKKTINTPSAQAFFVKKGVWIRPFRNLLYIMPPYIITSSDLTVVTHAMKEYCNILS